MIEQRADAIPSLEMNPIKHGLPKAGQCLPCLAACILTCPEPAPHGWLVVRQRFNDQVLCGVLAHDCLLKIWQQAGRCRIRAREMYMANSRAFDASQCGLVVVICLKALPFIVTHHVRKGQRKPLRRGRHFPTVTHLVLFGENCCETYVTWLISRRWPSGSRKKQGISPPQLTGGVKKMAPRALSVSYAAWQSDTRSVNSWLTVSGSVGGANVTVGLSLVGPPPVTNSSQLP